MEQTLAQHVAHLEGQLEGAMFTLRVGLAVIGALLALLIASVVYSYQRQASVVDTLRKRTHRIINFLNLLAGKLDLSPLDGNGD